MRWTRALKLTAAAGLTGLATVALVAVLAAAASGTAPRATPLCPATDPGQQTSARPGGCQNTSNGHLDRLAIGSPVASELAVP